MKQQRDIILIGRGYWGPNIARNLDSLGRLGLIVDVNPAVMEAVQKEHPHIPFTSNVAEALVRPEMRGVFIATPPHTHSNLAILAMRAGKDVFVEKPMSDNLEQAKLMHTVAQETGRILMVGHILLYHPAVQKLKEMIDRGEIGKIQYVYSNRLNFGQIRTQENTTWSFAPHDISVINYLLNEVPTAVSTSGAAHISAGVHDVTLSNLDYPSGVKAHIFVSWLHPYKEQRLVVIGTKKMAIFSDSDKNKLITYDHEIEWVSRKPVPKKAEPQVVEIEPGEPLRRECEAFLEAVETRRPPLADANNGYHVVEVLQASDQSLKMNGKQIFLQSKAKDADFFCHDTALVDKGAEVGSGTKIWHFSHVLKGAKIGKNCVIGQNVSIADGAVVGNNVKIQNNVSIYSGLTVDDDAFLGPSCVFTNVSNPRSQINRHSLYENTHVCRGATIGANATILCGVNIGRYAFVAAGTVVTKDVPDYALVMGNPGRQKGWMSRHGHKLEVRDHDGILACPESGYRYQEAEPGCLKCLDLDEEALLPEASRTGTKNYREFKKDRDNAVV